MQQALTLWIREARCRSSSSTLGVRLNSILANGEVRFEEVGTSVMFNVLVPSRCSQFWDSRRRLVISRNFGNGRRDEVILYSYVFLPDFRGLLKSNHVQSRLAILKEAILELEYPQFWGQTHIYKEYVCVCMYVCMYACMHACMHACMYVFMYVCMYVCTYVCMYVCMCIDIYIYT